MIMDLGTQSIPCPYLNYLHNLDTDFNWNIPFFENVVWLHLKTFYLFMWIVCLFLAQQIWETLCNSWLCSQGLQHDGDDSEDNDVTPQSERLLILAHNMDSSCAQHTGNSGFIWPPLGTILWSSVCVGLQCWKNLCLPGRCCTAS